jgi:5-methylcytosine-specific restriction endonuclease McrA
METLVLNSVYMPIDRATCIEAIGDLLTGRAEVVKVYDDQLVNLGQSDIELPRTFEPLRTEEDGVWKVPSVIRFVTDAVFYRGKIKFNRHNVWLRDGGRCQYCPAKLRMDEFTYDHVIPKSDGGQTRWKNIVVACVPCNHRKANRTPEQAGMHLRHKPFVPKSLPGKRKSPILSWKEGMPDSWKSFMESMHYWHGKLD